MEKEAATAACCHLCLLALDSATCSRPDGGLPRCLTPALHAAYFHKPSSCSCSPSPDCCPLCANKQEPTAILCLNALKKLAAAAGGGVEAEVDGGGWKTAFLTEVTRVVKAADQQVVKSLYDSRVFEALYVILSSVSADTDVCCLALGTITALAEDSYRDKTHRLLSQEGPYRIGRCIENNRNNEAVVAAGLRAVAAIINNDNAAQGVFESIRLLLSLPACIKSTCKTCQSPVWAAALQAFKSLLLYNINAEEDGMGAACSSLVDLVKLAAEEAKSMQGPDDPPDTSGIEKRCLALGVVADLCTDSTAAQLFFNYGCCRFICLLAVKRRFEEPVQAAVCRAASSFATHCPAARAFLAEPMSVLLRRFVQLQQQQQPGSGKDVNVARDNLQVAFRTAIVLCNNQQSTKAAELLAKEGMCEAAVAALRTHAHKQTVVVEAAKMIGSMAFMAPAVAEKFVTAGAQDALQECAKLGGEEVALALGALATYKSPSSARQQPGDHHGDDNLESDYDDGGRAREDERQQQQSQTAPVSARRASVMQQQQQQQARHSSKQLASSSRPSISSPSSAAGGGGGGGGNRRASRQVNVGTLALPNFASAVQPDQHSSSEEGGNATNRTLLSARQGTALRLFSNINSTDDHQAVDQSSAPPLSARQQQQPQSPQQQQQSLLPSARRASRAVSAAQGFAAVGSSSSHLPSPHEQQQQPLASARRASNAVSSNHHFNLQLQQTATVGDPSSSAAPQLTARLAQQSSPTPQQPGSGISNNSNTRRMSRSPTAPITTTGTTSAATALPSSSSAASLGLLHLATHNINNNNQQDPNHHHSMAALSSPPSARGKLTRSGTITSMGMQQQQEQPATATATATTAQPSGAQPGGAVKRLSMSTMAGGGLPLPTTTTGGVADTTQQPGAIRASSPPTSPTSASRRSSAMMGGNTGVASSSSAAPAIGREQQPPGLSLPPTMASPSRSSPPDDTAAPTSSPPSTRQQQPLLPRRDTSSRGSLSPGRGGHGETSSYNNSRQGGGRGARGGNSGGGGLSVVPSGGGRQEYDEGEQEGIEGGGGSGGAGRRGAPLVRALNSSSRGRSVNLDDVEEEDGTGFSM